MATPFLGTFTSADRTRGLYFMGRFWDKFISQPIFQSNPVLKNGVSFDNMIAYYDSQQPDFISWLGSLEKQYGTENMRLSVQNAVDGSAQYPAKSRFSTWAANNQLNSGVESNLVFAAQAVGDTVGGAISALPTIGKILFGASVLYFGFLAYIALKEAGVLKEISKAIK